MSAASAISALSWKRAKSATEDSRVGLQLLGYHVMDMRKVFDPKLNYTDTNTGHMYASGKLIGFTLKSDPDAWKEAKQREGYEFAKGFIRYVKEMEGK
jgi:hypothetical protein